MRDNFLQEKTVKVDLNIYKQEIVATAAYKFTGRYFVSQNKIDNDIEVSFKAKSDKNANLDLLEKKFENELIDQQIRYSTEQKFGHIRNLIVEKAFQPIS